jgi:hypothetical protein
VLAKQGMRPAFPVLLLALCGCDPTSGLADTADAALPSVKRYFDGPGLRVADGPWNRVVVDLDADTLYHVGARRLDDSEPTFHLFGADASDGCNVSPNAGTWLMGKPLAAPFRVLPFLENIDERGRGSLRFTTLDCQVQDLVIEDAGRPYPRLYDKGYLVPTKQGYTFVDPWLGTTDEIAEQLQSILIWKESILLWADGTLKSFTDQFERGDELGSGISAVLGIKDAFLTEDEHGLHKVTFDRETLKLTSEDVLADACHLQLSSMTSSDDQGAWVVLQLPCDSPKSSVVRLDEDFAVLERFELPFDADARHARALVSGPGEDGPEPLATLYLTDVDESGRGTLWAWRADAEAPIQLGEHADLDSVYLEATDGDWDGVAQTNYQVLGGLLAHDWVHFRWNGETDLIAERIVRNTSSGEVLVNFDGVAGDLPVFAADGLSIVAEDVPPYAGEATSYVGDRRYARIDHFDGDSGRALLTGDPTSAESWQELGEGVTPDTLRFSWFMPALLFLENWDAERKVGSLVAYNYELDARSTIADGVSSFDMTSYPWDGLIYTVPYGKRKGLWFSKAK